MYDHSLSDVGIQGFYYYFLFFFFFSELVSYITKAMVALDTKFKQDKRRKAKFTSLGPPDSLSAPWWEGL